MAKSKKWIQTKKAKTSRAKNLGQSGTFFITNARRTFIKLRQAFIVVSILNHFDLKRHIQIKTNDLDYAIDEIFG